MLVCPARAILVSDLQIIMNINYHSYFVNGIKDKMTCAALKAAVVILYTVYS